MWLTVHIRVTDADSRQPLAVRLRIVRADGTEAAPLGYHCDFPTHRHEDVGGRVRRGAERWYYIDGSCEIVLSGGEPLHIQATAGPDYQPLDLHTTLGAGQLTLRLALQRCWDRRQTTWKALDLRCHDLNPHVAALEGAAEGLEVVQLLARRISFLSQDGQTYDITPPWPVFSGQQPLVCHGDTQVFVNTLNEHPVLGRVALLHAHRPIFPLSFTSDDGDDWSVGDWCDQCHRKGGLTVWVDACEWGPAGVRGADALVAALLGQIDAIELSPQPRQIPLLPWVYHLWNAGILIPLVGSSAKESNRTILGQIRTYAQVQQGDWVAAIKSRRCCVSDGPVLHLEQQGAQIRATTQPSDRRAIVELIADGQIVARGEGEVQGHCAEAGWVAARLAGPRLGHTAPLLVRPSFPQKSTARAALRAVIERFQQWIETIGRFHQPKRRQYLLERCAAAIGRLEQPLPS